VTIGGVTCVWNSGRQSQTQNTRDVEETPGNIYSNGVDNNVIYADIARSSAPATGNSVNRGPSPNVYSNDENAVIYSQLQNPDAPESEYANVKHFRWNCIDRRG